MLPVETDTSWKVVLKEQFNQPYMAALSAFITNERNSGIEVYPPRELVLNAFKKTPFHDVKVVIVGQDPYHGPGQAHGLSFSVPPGIPVPPSLKNIYKELYADIGKEIPSHGCLNHWAEQGVLLLNATLTVRQGVPMSHHGKGWETFTDAVIAKLCERQDPIIFLLWGKSAQEKCRNVRSHHQHMVFTAPHPSPFSAHQGFLGCRHFSLTNKELIKSGKSEIKW